MSEKKYYTAEEVKAHWEEFIANQAEILRKELRAAKITDTQYA